jgi:hypothetical protein
MYNLTIDISNNKLSKNNIIDITSAENAIGSLLLLPSIEETISIIELLG